MPACVRSTVRAHIGNRLPQTDLARTIRSLAADPRSFYTGDLADRAVAALRAGGAPFSGDEWAAGADVVAERAIAGSYGGAVVHQTPLPTPGWMVLQQAALCDGVVGFSPWLSPEAIDRMARAARMSFEDRFEMCGSDTAGWRDRSRPGADRTPTPTAGFRRPIRAAAFAVRARRHHLDRRGRRRRARGQLHPLPRVHLRREVHRARHGHRAQQPPRPRCLPDPRPSQRGRAAAQTAAHAQRVDRHRRRRRNCCTSATRPAATGRCSGTCSCSPTCSTTVSNPSRPSRHRDSPCSPGRTPTSSATRPNSVSRRVCPRPTRAALRDRGHQVVVQPVLGAGGSAQVISRDERGILSGGADPRQEGVAIGVD